MTDTTSQAQTSACLRRQHFAMLSASDATGVPASAGVCDGASPADLVIYVMTRRHQQKARNIAQNPQVSLGVPVARRLGFVPPATLQLRGTAELLEWTDPDGTTVSSTSGWDAESSRDTGDHRAGEHRICFIRITVDPVVHTYMLGTSLWQIWRRMESGADRVVLDRPGR